MLIRVQGGTDAGRRRIKQRESWTCECRHVHLAPYYSQTYRRVHPGSRYACPDCGMRRPGTTHP